MTALARKRLKINEAMAVAATSQLSAMPGPEFYRHKADECVVAAKAATLNKERARHYELAEPLQLAPCDA